MSAVLRLLSSVVCLLALIATTLRADVVVLREGRAVLPVYVAADASAAERDAAAELARVLARMAGGAERPVQTERAWGSAGFYVGRTALGRRTLPPLRVARDLLAPTADEVGPDGFRVCTVRGAVFLEGATPEATAFAVSWLLQRHGGVRWYAPGALGEVIPRRARWVLPELSVVREPAYVSREITGSGAADWQAWCRHNGLNQRLEYSHNLVNLLPPDVYDAHPEWFALVNGARRRPQGGADYHWQPDLAREDVAVFAAQQAAAALRREPGRASFSLGMNDSVRFDQGEGTRAAVTPLRYFRGMPDYSSLLFGFMNGAAAALRREPGVDNRYLGCLAYFWAENPPPFPVDARVVPYVTTDRTQFYDRAYRDADYALMARWQRSGVRAYGLWEYAEGSAFLLPRVPHAALAEAVREGWWRGARGYMAECGPHAGFDSCKTWVLAQLLWEPDRPLAELETDFFTGWYGPAAEPMRRFFGRCEDVWMRQSGPPWWIKYYQQSDQLLLFPPAVCAELRALLDEAERRAEDGGQTTEGGGQTAEDGGQTADSGGRRTDDGGQRAADGGRRADDSVTGNKVTGDCGRGRRAEDRRRTAEDGGQTTDDGGETLTRSATGEGSRYGERVRLTSRAFAVTEAAVAFDALRRELAAVDAANLPAAELATKLTAWRRARAALEGAVAEATKEPNPALATANIGYVLRADPVPSLLGSLARRDPERPAAVLRALAAAGGDVPEAWRRLAQALPALARAAPSNRLANGSFGAEASVGLTPSFLHPGAGAVPAGWEIRSIATERSRIGLGAPWAGVRVLRIAGAWDTQVLQAQPIEPGGLCVLEAQLRGRTSPGGDAMISLSFLDENGAPTGEFRTATLPKGESGWRTLLLADTAPAQARQVVVGLRATRQFGDDCLEATGVSLRVVAE